MNPLRLRVRPDLLVALVLVVTFVAMLLGIAQHHLCLGFSAGLPGNGAHLCVSDVNGLYGLRGLAHHVFPYGTPGGQLPAGTIEYPVLTGLFGWAAALPAWSATSYFLITALVLTVVALWIGYASARIAGVRALLFAASPLLVLYGTQNWDLFPVAATVAGVWAWSRGRNGLASVAFAIGACFKIYPLLFLLPLYADVKAREGRTAAIRAVAPGVAVGVVVNVPFMLRNLDGWWQPFAFQSARPLDRSALSLWSVFAPTLTLPLVNALCGLALLVGIALVAFVGSRRLEREGVYPVIQVCAAIVAVWLLTAKASSPQYALWLLPFFVLLRVPFWSWLALTVSVVWCHVVFYNWINAALAAQAVGGTAAAPSFALPVVVRMAVLVALLVVFLRADPAVTTYGRAHASTSATPDDRPDGDGGGDRADRGSRRGVDGELVADGRADHAGDRSDDRADDRSGHPVVDLGAR